MVFGNSSDSPSREVKIALCAILRDLRAPKRILFAFCVHSRDSSAPCLNSYGICISAEADSFVVIAEKMILCYDNGWKKTGKPIVKAQWQSTKDEL